MLIKVQCIRKVFTALHFFHILLCYRLLIFLRILQTIPHNDNEKSLFEKKRKDLAVCLGSLSCWKLNLLPSLRFWMLWTGFSLSSQYFGAVIFSSTLTSPSVPAAEKQAHSMRLLPAHFTFGMVLCRWWAELVSFKHNAWNIGSSNQKILFLTVWGSFRCFFANAKCVFTKERIESCYIAINPSSVECCSDICPSVGFSYLHIWS